MSSSRCSSIQSRNIVSLLKYILRFVFIFILNVSKRIFSKDNGCFQRVVKANPYWYWRISYVHNLKIKWNVLVQCLANFVTLLLIKDLRKLAKFLLIRYIVEMKPIEKPSLICFKLLLIIRILQCYTYRLLWILKIRHFTSFIVIKTRISLEPLYP